MGRAHRDQVNRTEPVTSEALESALADVLDGCDARVGPFGPKSVMWTIGRESALIFGGLRSILLQLAHPFVAESQKW